MADSKVTDLTAASTPLSGTEVVYLVQAGNDVQATAQDVADLAAPVWGGIGGTLSNQTDLQAALDAKAPTANPTFTGTVQVTTLQADTSAGLLIESDNGTDVALFGAGGGSNSTFYGGVNISGAVAVTSTSASAFTVGANGATNPALLVDASTASSVTGLQVKSRASGAGVLLQAISSAASEGITIEGKGSSGFVTLNASFATIMQVGSTNIFSGTSTTTRFSNVSRNFTGNLGFNFEGIAGSNLTASTETTYAYFNLSPTQTHSTGALTLQRDFRINPPTHAFNGASTLTDAAGFAVDGAPIAGTNATITNSSTIYSAGRGVGSGTTNSYGLNIKANTGATNNYACRFEGSAGELVNLRTDGKISFLATNTAGGTTGNQTIDKPSGTVNFAAAATALTVTNSLCTSSSIVFAVVRTNDATATIKNVVPGSGSFTINLGAAATAETSVGFFIIN